MQHFVQWQTGFAFVLCNELLALNILAQCLLHNTKLHCKKEKYNKKHIEVATLTTSIINVITFLPMPRRQPCRASPNHSPLPRPLAETSPCHTTHPHSCRPTALAIQSTPRQASLAVSFRATHHRNARLQTRQLFLAYHTQRLVPPPRFPVFVPLSL